MSKAKPAAPAAPAAQSPTSKLMKSKPPAKPAVKAAEAPPQEKEVKTAKAPTVDTSEAVETLDSEDMIVKTAHEIENMKEDKAFKLVPTLLDNIDHDYFRLGGVLSVIQQQGWYLDKGFENFRAYVEADCGMQYRKSMYLIQIYNGLVESGVAWDDVKHLGWTKLKELAAILTPDNVAEWVALAENMTVLQLQEYIKAQTAGSVEGGSKSDGKDVKSESKKTTTMTFKLHEDQKQTIREALDKCKHETGTEVDTVALENICLNFLGGESKLAKIPTLAELMTGKSAEEVLGVFGEVFPMVGIEATLPE